MLESFIYFRMADAAGRPANHVLRDTGPVVVGMSGKAADFRKVIGRQLFSVSMVSDLFPPPGFTIIYHKRLPDGQPYDMIRVRRGEFFYLGRGFDERRENIRRLSREIGAFRYRQLSRGYNIYLSALPRDTGIKAWFLVSLLESRRALVFRNKIAALSGPDSGAVRFMNGLENKLKTRPLARGLKKEARDVFAFFRELSICRDPAAVNRILSRYRQLPAGVRTAVVQKYKIIFSGKIDTRQISPRGFETRFREIKKLIYTKKFNRARMRINALRKKTIHPVRTGRLLALEANIPRDYVDSGVALSEVAVSPALSKDVLVSVAGRVAYRDRRGGRTFLRVRAENRDIIMEGPASVPVDITGRRVKLRARFQGVLSPSGLLFFRIVDYSIVD